MFLSALARRFQNTPGVKDFYLRHYGQIRYRFHKLNRTFHWVNTPIYVHWLATYDCNFHCRHCEANAGEKKVHLLTTEEIERAVREMGDLGVKTFVITGGEPLLRNDIFEIISLAEEQGIKNICLATNGYLVNDFKRQLANANLSRIHISIDGTEMTNDQFRGKEGAFRKALEALDFFREIGVKERIVNTIVHQDNIQELDVLKKALLNSSATLWNIQVAVPVGRAKNLPRIHLMSSQFRHLLNFIGETRRILNVQIAEPAGYLGIWDTGVRSRPFFCGAGLETCSIMPDGEVLGCHIPYDLAYSEGNVRRTSFKSIWENGFRRFRHFQLNDQCGKCEHRHACRGGCWGMRLGGRHCLREIWEIP